MIERFLAYSRDHAKPIRVLEEIPGPDGQKKLAYVNLIVVGWDETDVYYIRPRKNDCGKPPSRVSRAALLSADYARGDHGDTLQYLEDQTKENEGISK